MKAVVACGGGRAPGFQTPASLKSSQSTSLRLCKRSRNGANNPCMQAKQPLQRPSVLFVTPDGFSKDVSKAVSLTKAVLDGGVSLVQVRDRKGSYEDIAKVTEALLAENVPVHRLVINGMDPRDVANMREGLGVHIKEKDIEKFLPEAKNVMSPQARIGCAVHSADIAKKAVNIYEPDYFQVGTMFATMSHPGKIPEGPKLLGEIRKVVGASPLLIGIGGIDPTNVSNVIEHGGDGVAVVTLLAAADDPNATAAELLERCQEAYSMGPVSQS